MAQDTGFSSPEHRFESGWGRFDSRNYEGEVMRKLIAGGLALALLVGCAKDKVTGKTHFMILSESDDVQMGEQAAPFILDEMNGELQDVQVQQYVSEVGGKLVDAARNDYPDLKKTPYKFHFHVVNDSMVNAFALPGGHVFVTRGTLNVCENEDQLAAVLGHEIMHVMLRHGARQMSNNAGVMILIEALLGGQGDSALGAAAMVAMNFFGLKYSRENEAESDKYGLRIATTAGYNPSGMAQFFQTLMNVYGKEPKAAKYTTDHPLTQDRIDAAQKQIAERYSAESARPFATQRNDTVLGPMKRDAETYKKADEAVNRLVNNDAANALRLINEAIFAKSSEGLFYWIRGKVYYRERNFAEAEKDFSVAARSNVKWERPLKMRAYCRLQQRKLNEAVADANEGLKILPDSELYYIAGSAYETSGDTKSALKCYKTAFGMEQMDIEQRPPDDTPQWKLYIWEYVKRAEGR